MIIKTKRHKHLRIDGPAISRGGPLLSLTLIAREQLSESIAADPPPDYTDRCLIERAEWTAEVRNECLYGSKTQPISLTVYEDSHAAHWMPMIETAPAPHSRAMAVQFTMAGCQPLAPGVLEYEQAFGEDRATIKSLAASYTSVCVFDPVTYVYAQDDLNWLLE